MNELHVWKVSDSETFWVVAASEEDAVAVLIESDMAEDWDTPAEYIADADAVFEQLPNDQSLTVTSDDGDPPDTRTCAEWIKDGRGVIGSTVY